VIANGYKASFYSDENVLTLMVMAVNKINSQNHQVLVAYAYNPSYLGGKRSEQSLMSAQANSSQNFMSKIPNTKKWLVE
jgi:hypothetical protein